MSSEHPEIYERFSTEDVLQAISRFLEYVGYALATPQPLGLVLPDIHARRSTGQNSHELVALIRHRFEGVVDGLVHLAAAKACYGDAADYALVLPPVSEYLTIEFFMSEKGRWYYAIRDLELMIWLCNPERETMVCLSGAPRDELFFDYFVGPGQMSFDAIISSRLSQELLLEEMRELEEQGH